MKLKRNDVCVVSGDDDFVSTGDIVVVVDRNNAHHHQYPCYQNIQIITHLLETHSPCEFKECLPNGLIQMTFVNDKRLIKIGQL